MARDHSWDEIADEYLSLYEDVIAEDCTTGPQQPLRSKGCTRVVATTSGTPATAREGVL